MNEFWEIEEVQGIEGSTLDTVYVNEDSEGNGYIILSLSKHGEKHEIMFNGGTWYYEKKRTRCVDCEAEINGTENYCPTCGSQLKSLEVNNA